MGSNGLSVNSITDQETEAQSGLSHFPEITQCLSGKWTFQEKMSQFPGLKDGVGGWTSVGE